MSLPNIPDINPEITIKRSDVINLLLASIALEEIGLSHILNAEGEKIQAAIHSVHHHSKDILDLIKVNKSVEKTLRNTIKQQILLQFKLEDVLELICPDDDTICEE